MVSVMRQFQDELMVATDGQGLYEITGQVLRLTEKSRIVTGQLTVFIRHTSASLVIQENFDPEVRRDLVEFFRRVIPEEAPWITHSGEGADDMPAHIKSALTQVSLTIPVAGGHPALGSWQGIYLFEHRSRPHRRQILIHVLGE
jgi:secondary thiamine-phosphate synthase enzyme